MRRAPALGAALLSAGCCHAAVQPAPYPGKMARIPAGTFWMGSRASVGDKDEHPWHRVHVAAFYMDVTEVTVAQYAVCVAAGDCPTRFSLRPIAGFLTSLFSLLFSLFPTSRNSDARRPRRASVRGLWAPAWRRGMVRRMGMFDRMGRVISSNFNALLDKAEDPEKSIELTLGEMRDQIRAARQEVVRGVAAEKQLRRKVDELDKEVDKWAKRAELAVRHDDDALAREALVQKQRLTADRDRAEALRAEQRGQALEMKSELERMEQKVEELKAKKSTLITRAKQARAGGGVEGLGSGGGPSAFSEFKRMEDQIEGVETAIQAQREVDEALGGGRGPGGMTRDEVEARFRTLEHGGGGTGGAENGAAGDVDDELSALKKKVRIGK